MDASRYEERGQRPRSPTSPGQAGASPKRPADVRWSTLIPCAGGMMHPKRVGYILEGVAISDSVGEDWAECSIRLE